MGRMYSRKKGKSGSTRPENAKVPIWNRLKEKEIEALIVKLSKEGKNAAQVGLELRDIHGVVNTKLITGKTIGQILVSKKLTPEIPDDLLALIKRSVQISKHLESNHKDQTAKRGLNLTTSKIRRLVKYYKAKQLLPLDWKFDAASLRLYIQ